MASNNIFSSSSSDLQQATFIIEIIMGCVITPVKLSILWFYHTIFALNPTVRKVIYATAAACCVWFIIVTFVLVFQCSPVDAYWNMLARPPACLSTQRTLLGYELTNLFLDVLILSIPVGAIKDLQLTPARKASTIGIFLMGAL